MNFLLVLSHLLLQILAWSPLDITIFDLQQSLRSHFGSSSNFYTILNTNREATEREIVKAYRQVSLLYHPDKTTDENAKEIYKLLTSVQALLKDPKSRGVYDKHLAKGFPTFRAGGYFYEKWEPGLLSSLVFVMAVVSVGQYLTHWIFYYQSRARLEAAREEVKQVPFKTKAQKKKEEKRGVVVEEEQVVVEEINVPTVFDLVIFKIPVGIYEKVRGLGAKNVEKVNKQE
jgi:preprotein translocase subunit Sec63